MNYERTMGYLDYDKKKLRSLQFNLDDNYDAVEKVFKNTSDFATSMVPHHV